MQISAPCRFSRLARTLKTPVGNDYQVLLWSWAYVGARGWIFKGKHLILVFTHSTDALIILLGWSRFDLSGRTPLRLAPSSPPPVISAPDLRERGVPSTRTVDGWIWNLKFEFFADCLSSVQWLVRWILYFSCQNRQLPGRLSGVIRQSLDQSAHDRLSTDSLPMRGRQPNFGRPFVGISQI